ncbi:GNAT family N-acetyltransferase [Plebeiibacterium sediminum]|uniref:GNAT family N-acetyltransferase n=1 Tax=Plebeiibacterium sediminum TaxID=2992112 RepID=A0AAE3M4R8_9BACT|nr:GNAT family N-acetyltransferase [Plebeiobacterium sediminum]MCW3787028.1 GNAT family N-acetyltransferase [Plebeiobacterium sediminum]
MDRLDYSMEIIDVNDKKQTDALLSLMNDYMLDDMGLNAELPEELGAKIVKGLQHQNNYMGFLLKEGIRYVALANCFIGFSTFKAKQVLNIHDFVVTPDYRRNGAGYTLLSNINDYCKQNNYGKVTLEVRKDNEKAMKLYLKSGFKDCNPRMYFWENIF